MLSKFIFYKLPSHVYLDPGRGVVGGSRSGGCESFKHFLVDGFHQMWGNCSEFDRLGGEVYIKVTDVSIVRL